MALSDLFSNSLISPALKWAKQQNIPQAAGSLLAAYAIPAIAGSLVRRPHRGQVQMMLAQPFMAQAFDYLQRPQRMRDFLTEQQITEQGLTPIAPTPDAKPVLIQDGMSLFAPRTLAEAHPEDFRASLLPPGMSGITPYEAGMTIDPHSLRQRPDVPRSLQILGGLPDTRQSIPALIEALQNQELQQAETERYQQSLQEMNAAAARNQDLVMTQKIVKGGYLTPTLEQRRGTSSRPLVLSPGSIAIDPTTKQEIGRGVSKPAPKETLSDVKLRALQYYQKTGQVPPGFTEEQLQNWLGMNKGNQLQDVSDTMDLRDLNKEAAKLREGITPFLPLLAKYPDGKIPPAELVNVQTSIEMDNPFSMAQDASPILAAQARLAEIEQQKQQLLQPKGRGRGTSAAPPSFSDFYNSLRGGGGNRDLEHRATEQLRLYEKR